MGAIAEHSYAPLTAAPVILVDDIGKAEVPPRWLELAAPLAADCSSSDCVDRYGFAEAKDHKLFSFLMCVSGRAERHRHVSVRTITDSADSASLRSILYIRQQAAPWQEVPVEEWNGHGFGVRPWPRLPPAFCCS